MQVIEYIQFLQEKANKYDSFQGWNHEQPNMMPLVNPTPEFTHLFYLFLGLKLGKKMHLNK